MQSGHVKLAVVLVFAAVPILGLQMFNGWLAGHARPVIIAAREAILEREDTALRQLTGERVGARNDATSTNMFEIARRAEAAEAAAAAAKGSAAEGKPGQLQ